MTFIAALITCVCIQTERTWTAKTGEEAKGTLVAFEDGKVQLRLANDKIVAVPFGGLTEEDQQYVVETLNYIPPLGKCSRDVNQALDRAMMDLARQEFETPISDADVVLQVEYPTPLPHKVTGRDRDWAIRHSWGYQWRWVRRNRRFEGPTPYRGILLVADNFFVVEDLPCPKGTMLYRHFSNWLVVDAESVIPYLKEDLQCKEQEEVLLTLRRQMALQAIELLGLQAKPYLDELRPLMLNQEQGSKGLAESVIKGIEQGPMNTEEADRKAAEIFKSLPTKASPPGRRARRSN